MDGNELDSLKEATVQNIVKNFKKENGQNLRVKLPQELGNQVYKALYQQRVFFKPGRIARIGQSFKITEGILNGRKDPMRFSSEDVDLLARHPLEKLTIKNRKNRKFSPARIATLTIVNMTGYPEPPFEEIFTKILKKNNHTLKSLTIYQNNMDFKSDWILTIHRYAKELTEFHFNGPEMTNEKFTELTRQFPRLVQLSLENTLLTSINPAFDMEHLTSLSLADAHFYEIEDLEQIFKFTNLQKLNISYDISNVGKSLDTFLKCNQVLPKLEFIDCSNNEITEDMLQQLIKSHTKLKTVSIIGTRLDNLLPLALPNRVPSVQYLTVADLDNCLRSMRFYAKKTSPSTCLDKIFHRLMFHLKNHYKADRPPLWDNPEFQGCFYDLMELMMSEENPPSKNPRYFPCIELLQKDSKFSPPTVMVNRFIMHLDRLLDRYPYKMDDYDFICRLLSKEWVLKGATVEGKATIRKRIIEHFEALFSEHLDPRTRYPSFPDMVRVCMEGGELCEEVVANPSFRNEVVYAICKIGEVPPEGPGFQYYRGLIEMLLKLEHITPHMMPQNQENLMTTLTQFLVSPHLTSEAAVFVLKAIKHLVYTWNEDCFYIIDTKSTRAAITRIKQGQFDLNELLEIERLAYTVLMAIYRQEERVEVSEEQLDALSVDFMKFAGDHWDSVYNKKGLWKKTAAHFEGKNQFLHDWAVWMRLDIRPLFQ